ncbi:MAG: hypothetical protein IKU29_04915 [Parabacteroides sp.]|nr:hypothetical protein [Parabacteroides sp.]
MSEQETHIGTLKRVYVGDHPEKYFEERCRSLMGTDEAYIQRKLDLHESWLNILRYEYDEDIFVIGNEIWVVDEDEEIGGDPCFCVMNRVGDKISFATSFYNGGTYLGEMLEDELERQFKNQK